MDISRIVRHKLGTVHGYLQKLNVNTRVRLVQALNTAKLSGERYLKAIVSLIIHAFNILVEIFSYLRKVGSSRSMDLTFPHLEVSQ